MWEWALDHRYGTASHDGRRGDSGVQAHTVHPLPMVCVVMLLVINSIYLNVLLATSGFGWEGGTVTAINWLALAASCWWSWDRLGGYTPLARGTHVDAPIELTEMLLPTHEDDGDDQVDQEEDSM